jgi:hypothetical protein
MRWRARKNGVLAMGPILRIPATHVKVIDEMRGNLVTIPRVA